MFLMLFAFFVATADLIPTPADAQVVIVTHPHRRYHHRHHRHYRHHRR
jgi:hypothetical protein